MWTPRRLLLYLTGLAAFIAAFVGYFQVLGRIDGLPPLPLAYYDRRTVDDADFPPNTRNQIIDVKLQRAFGQGCVEMSYNHRLELQKNGVILAMNQVSFEDGRCKLKPFSIAVVKDRGVGVDPEVYTVHADEAYLLFDAPVKNLAEMGKRRIVGCDLVSDPTLLSPDPRRHRVTCNHNRASAEPTDDMILETTGPVTYRELPTPEPPPGKGPPQIATVAAVRLTDRRGQPRGTTVTAQGLKIYLMSTPNQPAKPVAKHKQSIKTSSISGVRRVVLPEDVTMNLWIDPKSGFLAAGHNQAAAQPQAERSNVQITTTGPFTYNVGPEEDTARFEMKSVARGEQPSPVQVVRPIVKDGTTFYDRLDCEVLEMQFSHPPQKPNGPPTNIAVEPKNDSNLKWAHAWGQYLVLTSQAENLQANGNDLYHDAATKLTTLKGTPEVTAIKDGHEIHAPKLVLSAPDANGAQAATAEGEGYFRGQLPGGENSADGPHTIMARWRDRMHYRKDDGFETIHLAGAAQFEDLGRKQSISGDQIKLTLAPEKAPADRPEPPGNARVKPKRLEVTGSVTANSPELTIHDTDVLVLLFQDAPPIAKPVPTDSAMTPEMPVPAAPVGVVAQPVSKENQPPRTPKPPLDIAANTIRANLLARQSGPTELDDVHCEGRVKVHQDGANPGDKPIDMSGDALDLVRRPEGHKLTVTGDADRPAEVHLPDLSLLGQTIELDQIDNRANVAGAGAMRMLSKSDFQGNKLDRQTELHVSWKEKMDFDGRFAEFWGHVQANQDSTRLLCHHMQVMLDKSVRLGQRDPQQAQQADAANVEKVVCSTTGLEGAQPVSVEDSIRENGVLVRYQRIESRELDIFKKTGQLEAPGPGEVRILQPGPKNNLQSDVKPVRPGAPKAAPAPAEQEMKLTYVRYGHRLAVENEKRTAKFWRNVEVLHLPANDPGLRLNLNKLIDNLPRGALYLKCDLLEVYTEDQVNKKNHIMIARDKAKIQFDNCNGDADVIKFNESQQLVIFEGSPGRPAVLTRQIARGTKPETFRGMKFTYNRATGQFDGNDVISFSAN